MPLVTAMRTNLLNRGFRGTAYTLPSSLLWSPFSSSPAADGTGGTEITTGGAARRTVTWGTVAAGQASNSAAVAAVAGATLDLPLATHFALLSSAGAMVGFGTTSPAKQVNATQSWTLQPGEIQLADTAQSTNTWLSYALINALYAELLGGAAYSAPAHVFWSLWTAPPARDGTGGTEVSGTGYARAQGDLAAAAAGSISPSAAVNYGTAGSAWGRVPFIGAHTLVTGGSLMGLITLSAAIDISNGTPVLFPNAQLAFTET